MVRRAAFRARCKQVEYLTPSRNVEFSTSKREGPMRSTVSPFRSLITVVSQCSSWRVSMGSGRCGFLRAVALPALLLAFLALTAAPALAAPSWGIEMTHQNAYGAEGTVDPHTGSAATFARESGDNTYTI